VGDVILGVGLGSFWRTSLGPGPQPQEVIFSCFKKKTRRKSASLKPLIGLLAFVVWKLWSENNKLYNLLKFFINFYLFIFWFLGHILFMMSYLVDELVLIVMELMLTAFHFSVFSHKIPASSIVDLRFRNCLIQPWYNCNKKTAIFYSENTHVTDIANLIKIAMFDLVP